MMESAKEKVATEDPKPLVEEIIQLSDDFSEFTHLSAFLGTRWPIRWRNTSGSTKTSSLVAGYVQTGCKSE